MTAESSEVHRIPCPQCKFQLDPLDLVKLLPVEVLIAERARRNGLKSRPRRAGPGRPKGVARCPSCAKVFELKEFRDHSFPCLTEKLKHFKTIGQDIHLKPIDATEYKDFRVSEVRDEIVVFHKMSNMQDVEVPLKAIREIIPSVNGEATVIALRGAMRWRKEIERWRFSTE